MASGEGGRRRRSRFLDEADRIFGDDSREVEPVFGEEAEEELELFVPEQRAPGPAPRRRRGRRGETLKRILVAIPWIVFAIAITALGGVVFMAAMIGLGVI